MTQTPKVLVSDKLSETAVQIFRDRGIDVTFEPGLGKDKERLLEGLRSASGSEQLIVELRAAAS